MAATISIGGFLATTDGASWKSSQRILEDTLNLLIPSLWPSGSDPNPALHLAQIAAKIMGGVVEKYDKTRYVEGRIY